jgi:hypothetical protein
MEQFPMLDQNVAGVISLTTLEPSDPAPVNAERWIFGGGRWVGAVDLHTIC